MKTRLKENVWIEGFERKSLMYDKILQLGGQRNVLYSGKTSEIPEELAKKCVGHDIYLGFRKYNTLSHIKIKDWTSNWGFSTAKESIQSACNKKYCIIYKTN